MLPYHSSCVECFVILQTIKLLLTDVSVFLSLSHDGPSYCLATKRFVCRSVLVIHQPFDVPLFFDCWSSQGLCEKRAEAFVDCRTVHKVLKRAAEGKFPYLQRRCLEFCVTHLREVSKTQQYSKEKCRTRATLFRCFAVLNAFPA